MATATFSDDLISDLHSRQEEHAKCVVNAKKCGLDVNEACSVTAWKALESYNDWSRYRAPFKTQESEAQLAALMEAQEKSKKQ